MKTWKRRVRYGQAERAARQSNIQDRHGLHGGGSGRDWQPVRALTNRAATWVAGGQRGVVCQKGPSGYEADGSDGRVADERVGRRGQAGQAGPSRAPVYQMSAERCEVPQSKQPLQDKTAEERRRGCEEPPGSRGEAINRASGQRAASCRAGMVRTGGQKGLKGSQAELQGLSARLHAAAATVRAVGASSPSVADTVACAGTAGWSLWTAQAGSLQTPNLG